MEAETAKIITMLLLGLGSLLLGFLPLKIGKLFMSENEHHWKRTLTSILLCFGGGVLFATSLIHMLPEVRENLENSKVDFEGAPVAEILLCAGFFLIYLIEESVHFFLDSSVHHHHDETIQAHRAFSIHSQACEAGLIDVQQCQSPRGSISETRRRRTVSTPASREFLSQPNYKTFNFVKFDSSSSNGHRHQSPPPNNVIAGSSIRTESTSTTNFSCDQEGMGNNPTKSSLRDFFTVLALSFHAVFEGLAVGLENEAYDVWMLFAAVATHKYVISFCVGLELFQAKTRLLIYSVYMLVFALISPVGIGIGIAITANMESGTAYFLSVAIMQALAGGTIIYVVVFEVLERERSKSVSGLAQWFFVILGFSVMMTIELLAGHSHDHDHGHMDEGGCSNETMAI